MKCVHLCFRFCTGGQVVCVWEERLQNQKHSTFWSSFKETYSSIYRVYRHIFLILFSWKGGCLHTWKMTRLKLGNHPDDRDFAGRNASSVTSQPCTVSPSSCVFHDGVKVTLVLYKECRLLLIMFLHNICPKSKRSMCYFYIWSLEN